METKFVKKPKFKSLMTQHHDHIEAINTIATTFSNNPFVFLAISWILLILGFIPKVLTMGMTLTEGVGYVQIAALCVGMGTSIITCIFVVKAHKRKGN